MARLLFSGTALGYPGFWQELTSGPGSGITWNVESLYLINESGAAAAVEVAKVVSGHRIEIYNDSIPDGSAVEITDIVLHEGQALEIQTDEDLDYAGYGTSTEARDPSRNNRFDCLKNFQQGGLIIDTDIGGQSLSTYFAFDGFDLAIDLEIGGEIPRSSYYILPDITDEDADILAIDIEIGGDGISARQRTNWVGWSKIGEANFRADLVNDAGFMPMEWNGWVYAIMPLGKNPVIYGSGGVSILFPVNEPAPTYGVKTIMKLGVKAKTTVTGDQMNHYFIDIKDRLWAFSEQGLEKLGYEEFLSTLVHPVLSFDPINRWVLISDATKGFILTPDGLGGGYGNITGYTIVDGEPIASSPGDIITSEPDIMTGVLDFGYRGLKMIESLQFDLDTDQLAYAAVDFRYAKTETWRTSHWVRLTQEGVGYIRISGLEFRIRLRQLEFAVSQLSYINVQYKKTDYRYIRSNMGAHHGDNTAPA